MKFSNSVVLFLLAFLLQSCLENNNYSVAPPTALSDYGALRGSSLKIDVVALRQHLQLLSKSDNDAFVGDSYAKAFYQSADSLLWIERLGVTQNVDSLLPFLDEIEQMGFSPRKFHVTQINADLKRLRSLDFSGDNDDINHVMARLEYYLTKAYFNYAIGQQFGFMDPRGPLNGLDTKRLDSIHVSYKRLFDVPIAQPDSAFCRSMLLATATDTLGSFLRSLQPQSPLYKKLQALLATDKNIPRKQILCNMERCRWQADDQPYRHDKYVIVNIPAYQLYAVDGDSILTMRIACGARATKTPLLQSRIKRMDLNPQWIIPRSIIQNDIAHHAGNSSYFESRRYAIYNRKTGKRVDGSQVSPGMLYSGGYSVVQAGGQGNALGRIIFRFDNKFAVYLHDTSSPGVFSRDDRAVSHGCVRVQQPFDFAVFLLKEKDAATIDRIRTAMNSESAPQGSIPVTPEVPLFISYFTLFSPNNDSIQSYPDVYGYDNVMYQHLKKYTE